MEKIRIFFRRQSVIAFYLSIFTVIIFYLITQSWPKDIVVDQVNQKKDSTFIFTDSTAKLSIEGKMDPKILSLFKDSSNHTLIISNKNGIIYNKKVRFVKQHQILSEIQLIWLVFLIGAIASCLHGIVSLAYHVGNSKFNSTWSIWYYSRPLIGAILSLLFYLVLRAGFTTSIEKINANFYTISALSGLVGMFSRQALDKLGDIFDVIFKSNKEPDKKESNPLPNITRLDPNQINANSDNDIKVYGGDFNGDSVVWINNKNYKTEFISSQQLKLTIPKEDIPNPVILKVVVFNPPPEGGLSNSIDVNVI